jgi:hypothetical protein
VCDNTPTSSYFSSHYGSCYTQWDDFAHANRLKVAYSRDGGLTWALSNTPPVGAVGGQLLVLPTGRVVVVFSNIDQSALGSTISITGGVSFGGVSRVSTIAAVDEPGNLRSDPLASAEVSGDGKIYVVWADCRYRLGCPTGLLGNPTNDLVYKTSTNGTTWSPSSSAAPARIPIDPTYSTVDHFIPGVAVDRLSSGASIRVAVAYYFYPNVLCTAATCQLDVGYISSADGGAHWNPAIQLAGPMATSWLPNTTQGRMVGDYISTSFDSVGLAHPVFAFANASIGSGDCAVDTPNCDQALYTPASGLSPALGGLTPTLGGPILSGSPGNKPQKR